MKKLFILFSFILCCFATSHIHADKAYAMDQGGIDAVNELNNCWADNNCTTAHQRDLIVIIMDHFYGHGVQQVIPQADGNFWIVCGNGDVWKTKTPTNFCGRLCSTPADCTGAQDGCTACINGTCQAPPPPTPTTVPGCNVECSSQTFCHSAADGCTACLPNGSGKSTCQQPPACGAGCVGNPTLCQQNVTGCNTCRTNTTGSGPAQTCQSPAACGANCTIDPNMCSTVVNVAGCNLCLTDQTGTGTTKTCQTAPACGADCSKDAAVCQQAGGGCNQCVTHGNGTKTCDKPLACGSDCSTDKGICKQASGGCNVCYQNKCTQDQFNPGMCTCDGTDTNITTTIQVSNQDVVITGYGKVSATNSGWAKVKDMTFSLEKIGSTITMLAKSDPIPAVVSLTNNDKVQYKAVWTFRLPSNVQTGDSYQVTVATNCQRQILATVQLAKKPGKTMVLGMNVTNMPLLVKVVSTVKHLFGIKDETSVLGTSSSSDQLQIQTFRKVSVTKSCQSVNFQF